MPVTAAYRPVEPWVQQRGQAYDEQVQRAEVATLEHVPELVTHGQVLFSTYKDVLPEGDASGERLKVVKAYAPEPVPRLSLQYEHKEQPQQILWELPYPQ